MKTRTDILMEFIFPRYNKVNYSRFISDFSEKFEKRRNKL